MVESKFRINSRRKEQLKRLYGLTPEAYTALLEAQDFSCKICRATRAREGGSGYWSFSVDHCHKTGRVRGLLCRKCNTLLGAVNDNPTILLKAIQYLKGNL